MVADPARHGSFSVNNGRKTCNVELSCWNKGDIFTISDQASAAVQPRYNHSGSLPLKRTLAHLPYLAKSLER
jgi:hypothetical protein